MANRPASFQSTFYNTQGRKRTVNTSGSWLFRSDLFVSLNWSAQANGFVRTDMWATATSDPAFTVVSAYPVIGFTNFGGAARFRGWNVSGGWIDFANTVNFGSWNTLEMSFDADTDVLTYLVNGIVAATVNDNVSTGVTNVMYQAYNFNDPNPPINVSGNPAYVANWSHTAVVPEPSTYALMATGLSFLAAAARRRPPPPPRGHFISSHAAPIALSDRRPRVSVTGGNGRLHHRDARRCAGQHRAHLDTRSQLERTGLRR